MRTVLLFLTLVLAAAACKAPEQNHQPDNAGGAVINDIAKSRIDSTLKAMVDSGRVAGVSALIFEKNQEVYFNAFGYANREKKVPIDRKTLVRIWSMTKPITGTALMHLYETGAFQLDDPVSKYAPEFADMKVCKGVDGKGKLILEPAARQITIRDLTRHTAGFARPEDPNLGELVKKTDAMNYNNTLAQMAQKLASMPLAFNPGQQWAYGVSVDMQAYLVEKISGKPFDQYVRENVLDPLHMDETRYVPVDKQRLATTYHKTDAGLEPDTTNTFNSQEWPLKPGGFGFTSSIDNYMRFARMLVNHGTLDGATVLKPETVTLMSTNQLSDSVTERMWLPSKGQVGFGIDFAVRLRPPVSAEEKNGAVGEFFWDGAASTLFWVDPENEITAVLFVQIFPFSNELHKKFRDAVYGTYKPSIAHQ
jgi:CubicO group peptidase (beta-lactamase class C family)